MDDTEGARNNTPLIIGGCVGCLALLMCLGAFAGVGALYFVNTPMPVEAYDPGYPE